MVNVSGIHHLALFICHLFIDGHFRAAHLFHKSAAPKPNWELQTNAVCPELVPFYVTDITSPWQWPWNDKYNPNNVLQLIFFDSNSNNFAGDVYQLYKRHSYYRVFCFPSAELSNAKQRSSIFARLRLILDSKDLLVSYNTENVSVFIDSNYDSVAVPRREQINFNRSEIESKQANLFDQTFGEYERLQSFVIQRVKLADESAHGIDTEYAKDEAIWMHYYHLRLNNSFINMTWISKNEFQTTERCVLQPSDYYKELSSQYQCFANGNL